VPSRLLAVDTATEVCSVALALGTTIVERIEVVGQSHSERVLPMIQALLAAEGVELADLEAIAFGAGPGAFTGLRIACGVAQGLAFGIERPVIPIGNLTALARAAKRSNPGARKVLAAIDARMSEAYWAVYEFASDDTEREVAAPALASAVDLPALVRRFSVDLVAGNALQVFAGFASAVHCATAPDARADAGVIARLAVRRLQAGDVLAPEQAGPLYVRNRVALTIEERRAETPAAAGAR
jgi:tRNA threonylcarbamoyladenosine biosynthesis protein TsaB